MTVVEALIANPGVQLLGLLVAALLLSYAANWFLARVFVGRTYRFLIAPGVIIHEYSHALACILTGARIRQVRVFDAAGGAVVHEEPRMALGVGIISVAPILGAAIAVYLLALALVPGFVGFGELAISSWQFLLFAYLASAITAAMAPSVQDLRAGLAAFVALCAIIGLGSLSPGLSGYVDGLLGTEFVRVRGIILFSLIVLATLAAASAAAYLVLQRTTRQGVRYVREPERKRSDRGGGRDGGLFE